MCKTARMLIFIFLAGCLPEFPDLDQKNLCDPDAQCVSGYTCVCSDDAKICLKDNQVMSGMILAFKETVCSVEYDGGRDNGDSGIDAELDGDLPDAADTEPEVGPCENPTDEICDNLDNDCDGFTDEDFHIGEFCYVGIGECQSKGFYACQDESSSFCDAEPGQSTEETCDNLDNDCDGFTDEDLLGCCEINDTQECGIDLGECEKGIQTCRQDGSWGPCIGAVDPINERCDTRDNDCDGSTDEVFDDLNQECFAGVGECRTSGQVVCHVNELETRCNAVPDQPSDELCDNLDNDCDTQTDEELTRVCGTNIGECQTGIQHCQVGEWLEQCEGSIKSTDELCDDLDNDCDTETDEDFDVGDICFAGLGECQREGIIICIDEETSACNVVPGEPTDEVCDGLDNDCDTQIDEELSGCCEPNIVEVCGIDEGECQTGTKTCSGNREWGMCQDAVGPSDELCDGLDNDCDSQTDEDFLPDECCAPGDVRTCGPETEEGECQFGQQMCRDDRTSWTDCQDAVYLAEELCDELDNNCDGQTDENFRDPETGAYNTIEHCGVCGNTCGTDNTDSVECIEGQCVLDCARYYGNPNDDPIDGCECMVQNGAVELCNEVDDDCDGQTDEHCENVIMYLSFDRDSIQGNSYNDLSGNGNHATNHGGIPVSDVGNPWGASVMFDGMSSYAEVADSESMDSIGDEFTFIVSAQLLSSNQRDTVFSKYNRSPGLGTESTDDGWRWTFYTSVFGAIRTNLISLGEWCTFTGRYQAGQFTAFINEEQVWQGDVQPQIGDIVYLGTSSSSGGKSHIRIDEFSIFDFALSDGEIRHYNGIIR